VQPLSKSRPDAITLEKPAQNLASLVASDGLQQLKSVLLKQWSQTATFNELRKYGIRPIDRALFYGPPGNGKTMAAQVIASELECPLYRVRCESLLTATFGGTEKAMSDSLDWLSRQGKAVVLLDECETLFMDRAKSNTDACSNAITSTMQIFWQRLDRWETRQLFLLATNMIDRIDDALLSRIDLKLAFGPPTEHEAHQVVQYWEEVLHEYGAAHWGREIHARIASGTRVESFRWLWQEIVQGVRQWVSANAATET
jgi:SpoVK/Ycf46/Vps4 family AAA+-type ATPase